MSTPTQPDPTGNPDPTCGVTGRPPCPPQPATFDNGSDDPGDTVLYGFNQMESHGQACFDAGKEFVGQSFGARLDAALTASGFSLEDQDKIAAMFRGVFEAAKRIDPLRAQEGK